MYYVYICKTFLPDNTLQDIPYPGTGCPNPAYLQKYNYIMLLQDFTTYSLGLI